MKADVEQWKSKSSFTGKAIAQLRELSQVRAQMSGCEDLLSFKLLQQRERITATEHLSYKSSALVMSSRHGPYPTREFHLAASESPADPATDITIVTQLSIERLPRLEMLLERWGGFISAAVYIKDVEEDMVTLNEFRQSEAVQKYVDIHLMFAVEFMPDYPVNPLRNFALTRARTNFVLLLDVDLIPNPGARESLVKLLAMYKDRGRNTSRIAFVVPAFEVNMGVSPPKDKAELMVHLDQQKALPVHFHIFKPAHGPTDYPHWYKAVKPYRTKYEILYEPYLLVDKSRAYSVGHDRKKRPKVKPEGSSGSGSGSGSDDVAGSSGGGAVELEDVPLDPYGFPLYDEGFVGYGHDKAEHSYELEAAGYVNTIVPNDFVVHLNHETPRWRQEQRYEEVWMHWWTFAKRIMDQYRFTMILPQWLWEDVLHFTQWFSAPGDWVVFQKPSGVKSYFNKKSNEYKINEPDELKQHPEAVYMILLVSDSGDQLTEMFTNLDLDKSGSLSYTEIRQGMKALDMDFNEEELTRVVTALDPNKDQLVNLVEFTNAFSKILNAAGSGGGSGINKLKD
jgi:hypothetical protein